MSILLESLNQSKDEKNADVPSVADSHFDDEMLSDEWLLKKLKTWRLFVVYLLVFVLVSVSFFYYYIRTTENKISELSIQLEEMMINNKVLMSNSPKNGLTKENDISQQSEKKLIKTQVRLPENSISGTSKTATIKSQYQPQKQKVSDATNSINRQSKRLISEQAITPGKPTEFESLSEVEKNELPDLEIASYAVSSNPQKSFIVLNGAFYAQGEIIAPHLELISIDNDGIVIRYKGRFIRKKYSLQ